MGINDLGREGTFTQIDGKPLVYQNWAPGEPNNWRNNEDCGEFRGNGKWNDFQCSGARATYYVCFWTKVNFFSFWQNRF